MNTTNSDAYHLKLETNLNEVDRVVKLLESIGEKHQFDRDILGSVVIAVTEAVNNAIRHGNKLDARKGVLLDIDITGNKLVAAIQDEGEGFDADTLPDPLAPENILKESGRGVFLIRSLMENVKIEANTLGTNIRMEKTYITE